MTIFTKKQIWKLCLLGKNGHDENVFNEGRPTADRPTDRHSDRPTNQSTNRPTNRQTDQQRT